MVANKFIRFRRSHRRIKVYIIENVRRDGRVALEIAAYLGSIDAELAAGGAARVAFWDIAGPKPKHLANRLGNQANPLRMAVHPASWRWIRNGCASRLLQAEHDAETWHRLYGQTTKMIELNEQVVAKATEDIKELRRDGLGEIELANKRAADAEEIRKQLKGG